MKIQTLCLEISKNPESFDFQTTLNQYCQSPHYDPYFEFESLNRLVSGAISSRDDSSLIKACFQILEHYPFDIESHSHIAMSALRTGNRYMHNFHNFIGSSVLDLIMKTGNGLTENNPIIVYHPRDEGAVFSFLKKYPGKRELVHINDLFLDKYHMQDKTFFYFDISLPFKHLANKQIS